MMDFIETLKKEVEKSYKGHRIDIRYFSDDVGGKHPAIFLEPGSESSGMNSISKTGKKISFTVYYIDSYTSSKTEKVVREAQKLRDFITNNPEVRKQIVNINTNLNTKVEKTGEGLIGAFFGIISINIQLR